jgi:hypothetical protein
MVLQHLRTLADTSSTIFGTVSPPPGVADFNNQVTGAGEHIGLIIFLSNAIKLATVVAGLWTFYNFVTAGYIYITEAGQSNAQTKVKDQITMSVLGLLLIVVSYTIISLISLFFFHDATYILNPKIEGPASSVDGGAAARTD